MAANDIVAIAAADAAAALAEDIGAGDLSRGIVAGDDSPRRAILYSRENAVLCGRPWFEECFLQLDSSAQFQWRVDEGGDLHSDFAACEMSATPAALSGGERSALNFLQTLSATATAARRYVNFANGGATIVDTRKTLPKLRAAQKYAVRIGGAKNHRFGLFDEILIKENHIALAGGIETAMMRAKNIAPLHCVQVEARSLEEVAAALNAGAIRILLDNFSLADLREAVRRFGDSAELEASGGVCEETVAEIAKCGVHRISVGAMTKHIRAADFSLIVSA